MKSFVLIYFSLKLERKDQLFLSEKENRECRCKSYSVNMDSNLGINLIDTLFQEYIYFLISIFESVMNDLVRNCSLMFQIKSLTLAI